MYQIKIIDSTRGELALDLNDNSFPFNFESNTVANLEDASASWSYSIELPRSANNDQILGMAGTPFVSTRSPYKRFACNVYSDGVLIIRHGVLYIDTTTKTAYKIQIVSDNADVFELLDAIEFESMDASNGTVINMPCTTLTPTTPTTGKRYVINPDGLCADDAELKENTQSGTVYYYGTPMLRVGSPTNTDGLLNRVLSQIGYTLETDTEPETMDLLWLSLVKRDKWGSQDYMWKSASAKTGAYITNEAKTEFGTTKVLVSLTLGTVDGNGKAFVDSHGDAISPVNVFDEYFNDLSDGITASVRDSGGTQRGFTKINRAWFNANHKTALVGRTLTFEVSCGQSDQFDSATASEWWNETGAWSYYDGSKQNDFVGLSFTAKVWNMRTVPSDEDEDEFAFAGMPVLAEANIGIDTALDFFKILSQVFGWIVKVDGVNKVIYAHTFGYVKNRKSVAVDWSSRLDMAQDVETDFEFGDYAQLNDVEMAENKITGDSDVAAFAIDNEILEREKTAISIKISSQSRQDRIEHWIYDEDKKTYKWKDGNKPHLLMYDGTTKWNGKTMKHVTAADVVANYADLVETLQSMMVLTVQMVLSIVDIVNFDPYTPVYLKQYGKYFYVNKISDWEDGKECEVELLML